MRHIPLCGLLACSLTIPAAAQGRADTPRTACRNVGQAVTCTNVAPVPAAEALAIFLASTTADVLEAPPPFRAPVGSTYIGRIHGDVFSDRWPFDAAEVYAPVFPDRHISSPRRFSPWYSTDAPRVLDPRTGRWYRQD